MESKEHLFEESVIKGVKKLFYTSKAIAHYDSVPTEKSFSLDEACTTFFNWKDAAIENAKEYETRIRKLKLLKIMKSIMENELTQTQRDIVRLHYFEHKNGEEIANMYGINRSTVSRMISKIEGIFRENMRYAFEYSELNLADEVPPIKVAQAIAFITAETAKASTIGERVKRTRLSKLLTQEQVAEAVGMTASRLDMIEKSGNMTLQELMKLIFFFSVSADYIIFGV